MGTCKEIKDQLQLALTQIHSKKKAHTALTLSGLSQGRWKAKKRAAPDGPKLVFS